MQRGRKLGSHGDGDLSFHEIPAYANHAETRAWLAGMTPKLMMAMRLGGFIEHETPVAIGAIHLSKRANGQIDARMTARALQPFAIQVGSIDGDGLRWGEIGHGAVINRPM